jgi:hypothetical protein
MRQMANRNPLWPNNVLQVTRETRASRRHERVNLKVPEADAYSASSGRR